MAGVRCFKCSYILSVFDEVDLEQGQFCVLEIAELQEEFPGMEFLYGWAHSEVSRGISLQEISRRICAGEAGAEFIIPQVLL